MMILNTKQLRSLTQESMDTVDDKEFTVQEIKNAVASMGNKKAPGEDGITGEIFKGLVGILPRYITAIYNSCFRRGIFPSRWKNAVILPITKPGKDGSDDVSKFCPISLLDIGGKVLEKIVINRINHVFSQGFMNENPFGFTPQKGTIDAAMVIKAIVQEGLAAGEVRALVSLDVQGAFDAAWWPGILKELRTCGCPKNLYELTKSYFTQRAATLSTNSLRLDKK